MTGLKTTGFVLVLALICTIELTLATEHSENVLKFVKAIGDGLERECADSNVEKFAKDLVAETPDAVKCVSALFDSDKNQLELVAGLGGGIDGAKSICEDFIKAEAGTQDVQTMIRVGSCKIFIKHQF